MKTTRFINDKLVQIKPTKQAIKKLIKNNDLFFAEIVVDIDSENLRFFPVKNEKGGNSYPFGEHKIKVSEVGVKFILNHGSWKNIKSIERLLVAKSVSIGKKKNPYVKPFKDYVNTFYKLRKSGKSFDVIAKLFLNSLYGKFGQRLESDVKIINRTKERQDYPKAIVSKGDNLFIETFTEEAPFYNLNKNRLDIAGKITESARLYMGDNINALRNQNIKVYYTDTDSIIIENKPVDKIINLSDSILGYFSDEIGFKDSVIILGVKMYSFYKSGKQATKGIKKMTHENFREVIRGREKFENKRFTKLSQFINRGFFGIQKIPYHYTQIIERLD